MEETLFITLHTKKGDFQVKLDVDDYEKVKDIRWGLYIDPNGRHMARAGTDHGRVLMHRFLFDIPKGKRMEWLNGDTLDLVKENLQLVDKTGFKQRLREPKPPATTYEVLKRMASEELPTPLKELITDKPKSAVKGVYFHKASKRWHASAFHSGKRYSLGYFEQEQDAAQEVADFRKYGPEHPNLKRNQKEG